MTKIRKTKLADLPDRTSTLIGYAAGKGNVDYNTSKSVIYLFHEKLLSYLFQNYIINIPWFKPIRWRCTFSRVLKSNNWFKGVRYPERKFYIDTELENNIYYKVELVQKSRAKKALYSEYGLARKIRIEQKIVKDYEIRSANPIDNRRRRNALRKRHKSNLLNKTSQVET